jgi:hypothetical protein
MSVALCPSQACAAEGRNAMRHRRSLTLTLALTTTVMVLPAGMSSAAATPDRSGFGPTDVSYDAPWTGTAKGAGVPVPATGSRRMLPLPSAAGLEARVTPPNKDITVLPAPAGRSSAGVSVQQATPVTFEGLNISETGGWVPPDTISAKSPNRILEATNSAMRLFDNAAVALQTIDLNTFFNAPSINGALFDPKVYYDRNAANPRMFVVALQEMGDSDTDPSNNVSRIWVAISRSPDPANLNATSWCRYNFDGRRNLGTAQESWADFPSFGVGADSFTVSVNQFRFTDRGFTFAVLHVFNKTIATNNAASCPTPPRFTFQPSATAGNFNRFTIQPVQHYTSPSSFAGSTNPAYFVSTNLVLLGSSNQYHVYRVRNVAGGAPTMQMVTLTGAAYSQPAFARQPGGGTLIDTGDSRLLQSAGVGNSLVGTLTTGCNGTAFTPAEACTRIPRYTVGDSFGSLTATITENTIVGFGDNWFVHHAGVAMNSSLQLGAAMMYGGDAAPMGTAAMFGAGGAWTIVSAFAPGDCSGGAADSGDYNGAQTDPGMVNFWLAGESRSLVDGSCGWRTSIAQLTP